MELIYTRPQALKDVPNGYCPGCFHGLTQKLIAEVIDELDIRERAVFGGSIGCNGLGVAYANYDAYTSNHGRAAAAASAFKRCSPESVMVVYQGDGDASAIGMGETVNAAFRGEAITVIFANNGLYGMTGGQLAPTTLNGRLQGISPAPPRNDCHTEGAGLCGSLCGTRPKIHRTV